MYLPLRVGIIFIVLLCSHILADFRQQGAEDEILDPGNMLHYDPTSQTMRKAAKAESREAKIQPEDENIHWKIFLTIFAVVLAYLVYWLSSPYRHPPQLNRGSAAVVNAPQPAPSVAQVPIEPGDRLATNQPAMPTNNQQPDDIDSDNEEQLDVEGRRPATNMDTLDPKISKSHPCQPEGKPAKTSTEAKPTTSEGSQAEAKPLEVNTSSVGEETKTNEPQGDEPQALRDDIVSSVTVFKDQTQPEAADNSSMEKPFILFREGGATESPAESQPSHTDAQKLDDTVRTPVQESLSPFHEAL